MNKVDFEYSGILLSQKMNENNTIFKAMLLLLLSRFSRV